MRIDQAICCMDYIYTYTTQNARINKENIPTTLITINIAS